MSGNTPFVAVDSDVSPALLPLASQQAVTVSTTVNAPTVARGTSFPATPNDLDEYCYVADAANGIEWRFKYNSGSASAYKWEFVGGPAMFAEVTTLETTASVTYAALATAGPSIALVRAGDYDVTIEFDGYNTAASTTRMSYDIGGVGAVDADNAILQQAGLETYAGGTRRKTGISAATTLTAKYRVTGGTGNFYNRRMSIRPVRVI